MKIRGTDRQQLYEMLKLYCHHIHDDHVVFSPTVVPIKTKAASIRGKKKYTHINVDLAIDPTIFNQPDSIHMLLDKKTTTQVIMAIPKHHFNEQGMEHYNSAISNMEQQLDEYPELRALLDDFLPKWEAAFKRSIDEEIKKEAGAVNETTPKTSN